MASVMRSDQAQPQYYLLDVGREQYGDCIACVFPRKSVLIDGGHISDYQGQAGFSSIPEQLAEVLGQDPPFQMSLLVVTHAHGDHVGCLPELVANGDIHFDWALVADDRLSFGRLEDGSSDALDTASDAVKCVVAALREENHGHLVGAALDRFLSDAADVEPRYNDLLTNLDKAGTRIIRYGRDDHTRLEREFSDISLKVLGPSQEQLLVCAEQLARFNRDAARAVSDALASDAAPSTVSVYRQLLQQAGRSDLMDMAGKGACLNDMSIVLRLGPPGSTALMYGDMQLAEPEVPGLDDEMARLAEKIAANGPYDFIKLGHHTSYNAVDEDLLLAWGGCANFGHSGGSNDSKHPDSGALATLKTHASEISFARTDRNGQVRFSSAHGLEIDRGKLNDFQRNSARRRREDDEREEAAYEAAPPSALSQRGGLFRSVVNIPFADAEIKLTFEVEAPMTAPPPVSPAASRRASSRIEPTAPVVPPEPLPVSLVDLVKKGLGGGRRLPKLLFATDSQKLALNIGASEAASALKMVEQAGQRVLDVAEAESPVAAVQAALDDSYAGVVLLGGYDVLPAQRLDVLTPQMRTAMSPRDLRLDPDGFIVWSDSAYGDTDSDGMAECPVTRIPDAHSSRLVLTALSASAPTGPPQRFGSRNSARPFAEKVWQTIPGTASILVSGPATAEHVQPDSLSVPSVYFMLHGSDKDGSRFWGEQDGGGAVEAMHVRCLPHQFSGVVFSGCCWGALISRETAYESATGHVAPKSIDSSIALSLLAAGALAFVGCTGVHYSPDASAGFFGGPMHLAFWENLQAGQRPPAEALWQARLDYLAGMPHGQTSLPEQAIERKILSEFTCLGLGW